MRNFLGGLIVGIICMLLVIFGGGCGSETQKQLQIQKQQQTDISKFYKALEDNHRFGKRLQLLRDYGRICIIADLETGCQYLCNRDGGVCLIVDRNGDPYLINGRRDRE